MRCTGLAIALGAVFVAGGCVSASPGGAATASQTLKGTPASTTTSQSPTAAYPSPSARPPVERAKTAALRLSDLPDQAWTQDRDADPEGEQDESQRTECDAKAAPFHEQKPVGTAITGFSTDQPNGTESLSARVLVYSSEADAKSAMKTAKRLAKSCTTWTNGGLDGTAFRAREQFIDSTIGDDAFLIHGQLSAAGMDDVPPAHYMWVMAQQGDVDVLVFAIWPGGFDRGVNGPLELQHYAKSILGRAH